MTRTGTRTLAWLPALGGVRLEAWCFIGGSTLFTVGAALSAWSAAGALSLPSTGGPVDVRWVNLGTGLGALCFLAGAALLLPYHRRHRTA